MKNFNKWEEKLDKIFPDYFDSAYEEEEDVNLGDKLKQFISTLLQEQEDRFRGMIKEADFRSTSYEDLLKQLDE